MLYTVFNTMKILIQSTSSDMKADYTIKTNISRINDKSLQDLKLFEIKVPENFYLKVA